MKQIYNLSKKFKNNTGTFHNYIVEIKKISKDFIKDNKDQNINIVKQNELFPAKREANK